ncbi:MAG: M48 family metallopeptidase [Nitrospirae bacterium]|nr:M48 family metallopeptidase [Nitrospirota bacterium]
MGKYFVIILYLLVLLFSYWLKYLNLSHLKRFGSSIPPEFEGQIDQALLNRARDYTVGNIKFGFFSSIFNNAVILIFLFGGILDAYNSWIIALNLPFIPAGLIFFMLLIYADTILEIPFSLYHTFIIEKKYGFSTMTIKLWITDFAKSIFISTFLSVLIISIGLLLVQQSPRLWWFWVWCFFLIYSIFIIYISPYVIEPLFNKFTPIDNKALEDSINNLMQKVGIKVLYDTLIDKMNSNETLSVLAHEVGHWKKKHILKYIIVTEVIALIASYIAFRILQGELLINLFNIKESSFFAKAILLGFLGSIAAFPFTPLFNYFSRKYEIEADRFACELTGEKEGMISALVKLSKDNLSNLHPHPLYAAFYYSHPPVLKRVRHINSASIDTH